MQNTQFTPGAPTLTGMKVSIPVMQPLKPTPIMGESALVQGEAPSKHATVTDHHC